MEEIKGFSIDGSEKEKSKLIEAINALPKDSFNRLPESESIYVKFSNEFGVYGHLEEPIGEQVVRIARSIFDDQFTKFKIPAGAQNVQLMSERNRGITNFDYQGFRYELWM